MKRASVVIVIALLAAVAARIAEPAHQRQAHFSAALACGVERWSNGATAYRRTQMANARNAARLCSRARVTGVALFDFLHGQTGMAPNGIELHPVLDFVCLA